MNVDFDRLSFVRFARRKQPTDGVIAPPGVGPVVAPTYRATVHVPVRFRKSKSVGAVFGLTCSKYQSGELRPSSNWWFSPALR